MIIAPFPFESLPAMTRADVAAQARVRDLIAKYTPLDALEQALTETLKAPVQLRMGKRRGSLNDVSCALAASDHVVVIGVETALAREVVGRALSHSPGIDAGKPPSAALHGAFAAVLIHALRKANLPVRSARPAAERALVVPLLVSVGDATFNASVTIPDRVPVPTAPPASLDFPIALPLVAISCLASRDELAGLTTGDVFLPPGLLTKTALALVAPRAERGVAVELTPDHRLVIGKEREAQHSWEPPMSADTNPTLEVALEAPVVVRVELGAVEMKAREWAALAEGDVISLQRKLGEPAILRIAGNEVARGELVQVDGEYGIRITSTHR